MKVTLKQLKSTIKSVLIEQHQSSGLKIGDRVKLADGATGTIQTAKYNSQWETYTYLIQLDPEFVGSNRVGTRAASEESLVPLDNLN